MAPSPGKLAGKIALVTGGSSGIGLATARRFIAEGAYVFITGRRVAEVDTAVKELGPQAAGVPGDISNLADLDRLFDIIRHKKGRLDIIFANAGGGAFVPLEAVTEEHFDKYFVINVKGTLFTVQKALPLLAPGSSIVLNGSNASVKALPAFSVYSATKAALRSFARNWTLELKARKIRVNIVNPGIVVTPGYKNELKLTDEQIAAMTQGTAETVPAGRPGTPEEIAAAVLFLASDESSYVTGAELFVDGGFSQV